MPKGRYFEPTGNVLVSRPEGAAMTTEDNQTVYEEILGLQPEDEFHRAVRSQALIRPERHILPWLKGACFM